MSESSFKCKSPSLEKIVLIHLSSVCFYCTNFWSFLSITELLSHKSGITYFACNFTKLSTAKIPLSFSRTKHSTKNFSLCDELICDELKKSEIRQIESTEWNQNWNYSVTDHFIWIITPDESTNKTRTFDNAHMTHIEKTQILRSFLLWSGWS